MKENEKEVQKALGLVKKYRVILVASVPRMTSVDVPFEMSVEAMSEKEAMKMARASYMKMSCEERKEFAWENVNEDFFNEYNSGDNQTELWDYAQSVPDDKYNAEVAIGREDDDD